jgi:cytoskeletal protein CcmA (bactofilin family)
MDAIAQIGPSIHIKGEITAEEPLAIAGQVEGTVKVNGHTLTLTADARVTATVAADTVVIGGRVNGRVQGGSRIVVRESATIEGDLAAPTITFADGAQVNGRIETAARGGTTLRLAS